jgi:hypothetical protein
VTDGPLPSPPFTPDGTTLVSATLAALEPLPLLVADAATLHLDLAATQRGYTSHF